MSEYRKRLAVFDIDGTLFRWQLYHELVFELARRHSDKSAERELNEALRAWKNRQSSWEIYEGRMLEIFRMFREQLSEEDFDATAEAVVADSWQRVYVYTKTLITKLQKEGYFLLAITGSQQEVAEPFAKKYGFDECIGGVYRRKDGHVTGEHIRFVPGNKAKLLGEFCEQAHLSLAGSIGVGDSGSDIDMLELVEMPIAFNPSPALLETARQKGWQVIIERKNIAYTLRKGTDGSYLLADTIVY